MIHVICTDISGLREGNFEALHAKVSPARRERAAGYLRRADAVRCLAADALLRYALGPGEYTEEKGTDGKPHIRDNADFHYNLSHSGNWVVIAYGGSRVGVDVEGLRLVRDYEALARRYFAPEEQAWCAEGEDLSRRFLEVWTGKESYLKYMGTGLSKALPSFSIFSLEPEVRLHRWTLPGGYELCLCSIEEACRMEILEISQLL